MGYVPTNRRCCIVHSTALDCTRTKVEVDRDSVPAPFLALWVLRIIGLCAYAAVIDTRSVALAAAVQRWHNVPVA